MLKSLLWAAAAGVAVSCGILAWRRRPAASRARVRRVRDRLARAVRAKPRRRRRAAALV